MSGDGQNDPEQNQKQNCREDNETVTGNPFFIPQRTQSMHAACREVIYKAGIGGCGPAKMGANAVDQRRQVVFADAKLVVLIGGGRFHAFRGLGFDVFKNRDEWIRFRL